MANKVRYGLKKVHYARITAIASDGTPTYGAITAIPGAVSLTLDPQGEDGDFYADDSVYYTWSSNNGYDGTLEVANADAFINAVLPTTLITDTDAGATAESDLDYEMSAGEPEHFALLFEFNGDANATRYAMLNCIAGRPSVASKTTETGKEIQTASVPIKARPIKSTKSSGVATKVRCTSDTNGDTYKNWFTTIGF